MQLYLSLKSNLSAVLKIETISRKKLQSGTPEADRSREQFIFPPAGNTENANHKQEGGQNLAGKSSA